MKQPQSQPRFEVFNDARQRYLWQLKSPAGEVLARGVPVKSRNDAVAAIGVVRNTVLEAPATAQDPPAASDPLTDPVNLLRWTLNCDPALMASLAACLANLNPADKTANRAALTQWITDAGLVDTVTKQPVFTVDQLAAAMQSSATDPLALTDQERADALEFAFNIGNTMLYRAEMVNLSKTIAAINPATYGDNEDQYYADVLTSVESFIDDNRRPALVDNLNNSVPASTVSLSTLARTLNATDGSVQDWWGSYNYVVATYHDASRAVTAPATGSAIAALSAPSAVSLATTPATVLSVDVYGRDNSATPVAVKETVQVPGTSTTVFSSVLGVSVTGDSTGSVPDGTVVRMASSTGAMLMTITVSAANPATRKAGSGSFNWVAVDQTLQIQNPSAAGSALLVGKGLDASGQPIDLMEALTFTAGQSVTATQAWAQVDTIYLGNFAGTLQLSAPHSLNGQTRKLDPTQSPIVEQAPQVTIGAPEYALTLSRTAILNPTYDATTSPPRISFQRATGQPESGYVGLLSTSSPRGDANLTGYYLVGTVTFPKFGSFKTSFELWGDVTLDCMKYQNAVDPAQTTPAIETAKNVFYIIGGIAAFILFLIGIKYGVTKWKRSQRREADWESREERAQRQSDRLEDIDDVLNNANFAPDHALTSVELQTYVSEIGAARIDITNAVNGWPKASEHGYALRQDVSFYQREVDRAARLDAQLDERLTELRDAAADNARAADVPDYYS